MDSNRIKTRQIISITRKTSNHKMFTFYCFELEMEISIVNKLWYILSYPQGNQKISTKLWDPLLWLDKRKFWQPYIRVLTSCQKSIRLWLVRK